MIQNYETIPEFVNGRNRFMNKTFHMGGTGGPKKTATA